MQKQFSVDSLIEGLKPFAGTDQQPKLLQSLLKAAQDAVYGKDSDTASENGGDNAESKKTSSAAAKQHGKTSEPRDMPTPLGVVADTQYQTVDRGALNYIVPANEGQGTNAAREKDDNNYGGGAVARQAQELPPAPLARQHDMFADNRRPGHPTGHWPASPSATSRPATAPTTTAPPAAGEATKKRPRKQASKRTNKPKKAKEKKQRNPTKAPPRKKKRLDWAKEDDSTESDGVKSGDETEGDSPAKNNGHWLPRIDDDSGDEREGGNESEQIPPSQQTQESTGTDSTKTETQPCEHYDPTTYKMIDNASYCKSAFLEREDQSWRPKACCNQECPDKQSFVGWTKPKIYYCRNVENKDNKDCMHALCGRCYSVLLTNGGSSYRSTCSKRG